MCWTIWREGKGDVSHLRVFPPALSSPLLPLLPHISLVRAHFPTHTAPLLPPVCTHLAPTRVPHPATIQTTSCHQLSHTPCWLLHITTAILSTLPLVSRETNLPPHPHSLSLQWVELRPAVPPRTQGLSPRGLVLGSIRVCCVAVRSTPPTSVPTVTSCFFNTTPFTDFGLN